MRRKIIGFVFLFLCLFLLKGKFCSAAAPVETGSCGEHATWTLDDENVLTIRGTGKISDNSWVYSWRWDELTEYPSPYERTYYFDDDDPHFVTVVIENGITEIGAKIFSSEYIKKVSIPDSVTVIGACAFQRSSIKRLELPDSVVDIGQEAFDGCQRLTEIRLSEQLTQIPDKLFYGCESLVRVKIPDSVIMIGSQAFDYTRNLKEITLGKNLVKIPERAFQESLRLRKIVNRSNTPFSFSKIGVVTKRVTWHENGGKATDISPGKTLTGQGKKYKLRYALDGAKVNGKLPKSFRYGDIVEFPGKVTKKGYLFAGWKLYHNVTGGWWEALQCDQRGVICYDGLLSLMSESASYKISPIFVKMKVQKKAKKTVVLVDCKKVPFDEEALDNLAIRFADNKKMKRFQVACKEQNAKTRMVKYVLPKSFRNRRCYVQCAVVDNVEGSFLDFCKDVGWKIADRHIWFWSKSVVCGRK